MLLTIEVRWDQSGALASVRHLKFPIVYDE